MGEYRGVDLTIAIVNYNTKNLLKQAIRNIISLNLPFVYQILIIDNHSEDESVDFIEKNLIPHFPNITLIQCPQNLGFGGGYNFGLRAINSPYLLLINPDIIIQKDSITKMYHFMQEDKKRGVVGPKLTYPDTTTQRSFHRFPTMLTPVYRRTVLGKTAYGLRELRRYDMVGSDEGKPIRVDWVVGACMFIRKEAWDAVCGFDKRYFLYYEDIDLCRKMWQAGYEVWYYPYTHIIHFHKRLSARGNVWKSMFEKTTRIHLSSHIKYFRKWGM